MTTMADLLALPAIGTLDDSRREDVLLAFLDAHDKALSELLGNDGIEDWNARQAFMERISGEILLHAADQDKDDHYLVRLTFDGAPVAMLKCHVDSQQEDRDRRLTATIALVGRDVADRLCDAAHDLSQTKRLTEASPDDNADSLVSFGPTAVMDITSQSLTFKRTERLLAVGGHYLTAVLLLVEDGRFVISERGELDRATEDGSEAADAFMATVHRSSETWNTNSREVLMLHGRDDSKSIGLVANRDGMIKCSTMVSKPRGIGDMTTDAEGPEALSKFLELARSMIDETIAAAEIPGAAIPRT